MRFFPQDNQKHLWWHAWIQEMISLPQSMTNTPIGTTSIIASTIIIHLLIFIIIIVFHWGGWHQLFQPLRAPWGVRRVVFLVAFACAGALDDDDELAEKVGPLDYLTPIVPVLKF
jgi:hypothetical protein